MTSAESEKLSRNKLQHIKKQQKNQIFEKYNIFTELDKQLHHRMH